MPKVVTAASPIGGRFFADLYREAGYNFHAIPPEMHTPSVLHMTNINTGIDRLGRPGGRRRCCEGRFSVEQAVSAQPASGGAAREGAAFLCCEGRWSNVS